MDFNNLSNHFSRDLIASFYDFFGTTGERKGRKKGGKNLDCAFRSILTAEKCNRRKWEKRAGGKELQSGSLYGRGKGVTVGIALLAGRGTSCLRAAYRNFFFLSRRPSVLYTAWCILVVCVRIEANKYFAFVRALEANLWGSENLVVAICKHDERLRRRHDPPD